MKQKAHPEFRLDSFSLVNFILKHWRLFLITGVIAAVLSALVSLLITPRYSSEVILYPSASVSGSGTEIFNELSSPQVNFGDEEAVEKILQILHSDDIKDRLVNKYKLFEHYEIDPDTRYRYTILDRMIDRNIDFSKTRFMSVRVTVMDKDPFMAADMANDIAEMIDSTFNRLIKAAGAKYLAVMQRQYNEQLDLISLYGDSLRQLRKYTIAKSAGRATGDSRVDDMAEYGPDFVRCSENHEQAMEDLGMIRQKLTEAKIAADEDFPYTLIVNEAKVSEKKSFPRRTIIVVLTTVSTLLFVLLVMIIIEGLSINRRRE